MLQLLFTGFNKHNCFFVTELITAVEKFHDTGASGLYCKPMTIVNSNSRVVNRLETSLTDDAKVVIYDRHMYIVQATGLIFAIKLSENHIHSLITFSTLIS